LSLLGDPVLGRKGKNSLSGDETVVIESGRAGYGVYYNPAILVQHAILQNWLPDYFVRHAWGGILWKLLWKVLDKPDLEAGQKLFIMYMDF